MSDPASDVLYLRDEDTGEPWSATPAPIRHDVRYTVRHGAGTSSFEHRHAGHRDEPRLGLAEDRAVKLSLLRVTNLGARRAPADRHRLTSNGRSACSASTPSTRSRRPSTPAERAIFARNFFDPQFAGHVAFCAISEPVTGYTADRREFLGRNGTVAAPAGLHAALTGATGAGLDPCAALRCALTLEPGETRELVVVLGATRGRGRRPAARWRSTATWAARRRPWPARSRAGRTGCR